MKKKKTLFAKRRRKDKIDAFSNKVGLAVKSVISN